MSNKYFDNCAFRHYILNYHGNPVIVEDFSDGDMWSDDEIWGSFVVDMKNKKYLFADLGFLDAYNQNPVEELDLYKENEWMPMEDHSYWSYGGTKKYYLSEIEKYEKMNPKPEILELDQ